MLRRCGWILVGLAGLPGLLVGIVTLTAVFLVPLVFGFGLAVGRSSIGLWLALALFCPLVVALAIGLVRVYGTDDWFFYYFYGTSVLFAFAATFKLGLEARLRLFQP